MFFVKSICALVVCCGMLAGFLVTYSYISGDRDDREEMQATLAQLLQRADPTSNHESRSISSVQPSK